MIEYGCKNCKHLKCYKGDYWTPDEYECTKDGPPTQELCNRVWSDGETWSSPEDQLCPYYEELKEEDYYYED